MRAILTYLGLVGVPLVAMLGVLRLGKDLHPPRAAHGLYAVTFDSSGSGRCVFDLLQSGAQRLDVAQSGARLELRWGELRMSGTVAGDSLRAAAALQPATPASCLTGDTLVIAAAIDVARDTGRLVGAFRLSGCATCTPVPFRAARLARSGGA